MKKLFLSVVLLCTVAIAAQAQVKNITVQNNCPHTVSVILHGDPTGFCGTPYLSNTFVLVPGAILNFPDPGAVPAPHAYCCRLPLQHLECSARPQRCPASPSAAPAAPRSGVLLWAGLRDNSNRNGLKERKEKKGGGGGRR